MNFRFQYLFEMAVILGVVFGVSSCSKGNGSTATIKSVSITPTTASVPLNTQFEFSATVNLSATSTSSGTTISTDTAVTWEVNGAAGGNSTLGTIVPSSTDAQVGVYTAPAAVPTTNNGQVNITAVATQTTSGSSTGANNTVTSNVAVVTIGAGLGLAVSPTSTIVSAGAQHQFTATNNGLIDTNATWSVSSPNGGTLGTIDPATGVYTAPLYPPPGGSVTITATDGANSAVSTAEIIYSDHSLSGPYAFSYTGADSAGFQSVAGSFVADGNGHLLSGIEDVNSAVNGISTEQQISGTGNTYVVGTDGRGTATINGATVEFVMTTNQHAALIRFNSSTTGSGTIDQQDLNVLVTLPSVISGPYSFSAAGVDASFKPLSIAGRFSADGAGNLPGGGTIVDQNDNGVVSASDTSLSGFYSFDVNFPGSGRGTLTLNSTATGQLQFAFYITNANVGSPTVADHLYLVEIDHNQRLGGTVFSAPAGNSFTTASFVGANYAFIAGGNSSTGAHAAGGVFAGNGSGSVTGGTIDSNNAGTVVSNTALGSCAYTVDATTGRIDLKLFAGNGACPATPSATISEFSVYQTAHGPALMVEIDSNAISSGLAFQQIAIPASINGNFALSISGQGFFHNAPASYQPDTTGQVTLNGSGLGVGIGGGGGNFDINTFNAAFASDIISTATSTLSAPAATTGRGAMLLNGTSPNVTYSLVYYPIDAHRALLFDQDKTRIAIGLLAFQF